MINRLQIDAYTFLGLEQGLSVLILGCVHGDEICGTEAINQIINLINTGKINVKAGKITMIPVTNPLAASKKSRVGDRNLNRCFYTKKNPKNYEDKLNNILCPLIKDHDVLLDLHSFKKGNKPFALIGKKIKKKIKHYPNYFTNEVKFASWLGVNTVITNWTQTYSKGVKKRRAKNKINTPPYDFNFDEKYGNGTTEFTRNNGLSAVTLECGQHSDPKAKEIGINAILSTLSHLNLIKENYKRQTSKQKFIKLFDVIDKHHPKDFFYKNWKNFDKIKKGTIIGERFTNEKIVAPKDIILLFPSKNAEIGQEWIYFAELIQKN